MTEGASPPHKRRVRYSGTHPRQFEQKYKELNPLAHADAVEKVLQRGQTPAGMHRPICVEEILAILNPQPGERGLDATLGFGGHTQALLARVLPGGGLVGLDVDSVELPRTRARLQGLGFAAPALTLHHSNFSELASFVPVGSGGFDFVLADLGVSSMQIDNPTRGFSFKADGPLDLRLDPGQGEPASALLQSVTREEVFGPVAVATASDTEDEAILLAIDSDYGLEASVWTRELNTVHFFIGALEVGVVWVSGFGDGDTMQPFRGYARSGNSRDKHRVSLLSYTRSKSAWFNLGSCTHPPTAPGSAPAHSDPLRQGLRLTADRCGR